MAYTQNYIRLTDKFLIERNIDEVATFMTIDGHDFQDFVLELQSNFTTELELQVINIDASLDALSLDIDNFKAIESEHYSELSGEIDSLNVEVNRNRVFIESNKEQLDIINEQTRLVGNYTMVRGDDDTKKAEMSFLVKGRGPTAGTPEMIPEEYSTYEDVIKIIFNQTDSLDYLRTFDNLLVGDILEIAQYNEYAIFTRATFQVTTLPVYAPLKYTYTIEVEFISGAGDGSGIPYKQTDDETGEVKNDRVTRCEAYPSVDLQEMALTEDYKTLMKNSLPIGIVMPWVSTRLPAGFHECNGTNLGDDTKYDDFSVIYGRTTPDMRGRALVGYGAYGATTLNAKLGQTTAAPSGGLTMTSNGSHTHTVSINDGGTHTHKYGDKGRQAGGTTDKVWGGVEGQNVHQSSSAGSHTHTSTVSTSGTHKHTVTGWDTYNRMYSYVTRWIVKTHHV